VADDEAQDGTAETEDADEIEGDAQDGSGAEDDAPEDDAPEDDAPEDDAPEDAEDAFDDADGDRDRQIVDGEFDDLDAASEDDGHEEDLLPKDLPPAYCYRPWREMVGALFVVALIVAGVTLYRSPTSATDAAMAAVGQLPVGAPFPGGVTPAAFTTVPPGALPGAGVEPRTAFNSAAHVIRPSVVGIRVLGTANGMQPGFERVGSGVIVSSAGYILTCTHVIRGASQITLSRFRHAGERIPAQVVASDGELTLLRANSTVPLPAARFANPNALGVGDWVLALGHPFGMGLSVSAGIVGRRNAELTMPGGMRERRLVQTDASINEGSSGGPLVNLNGEVVGLNLAIFAPTGVFSGAGFAIDSGRALAFLQRHLGAQRG